MGNIGNTKWQEEYLKSIRKSVKFAKDNLEMAHEWAEIRGLVTSIPSSIEKLEEAIKKIDYLQSPKWVLKETKQTETNPIAWIR